MIRSDLYLADYGVLRMTARNVQLAEYAAFKIIGRNNSWTDRMHYGLNAYAQALVECGYKVEEA